MGKRFELALDWSTNGNVAPMARHGVSVEEVEEVLMRGIDQRQANRGEAEWVVAGYTDAGRFLVVVFDLERVNELGGWLVTPRTAFEPHEEL